MSQEKEMQATHEDFSTPLAQLRALLSGQSAELRGMIAEAEQLGVPVHIQPDMETVRAAVPADVFEQLQRTAAQVRDIDEELSARPETAAKLPRKMRNRI